MLGHRFNLITTEEWEQALFIELNCVVQSFEELNFKQIQQNHYSFATTLDTLTRIHRRPMLLLDEN